MIWSLLQFTRRHMNLKVQYSTVWRRERTIIIDENMYKLRKIKCMWVIGQHATTNRTKYGTICWHGKERQKQKNDKQTNKQTNEKEQDKHQYKNNKLQCKHYLISGPLLPERSFLKLILAEAASSKSFVQGEQNLIS